MFFRGAFRCPRLPQPSIASGFLFSRTLATATTPKPPTFYEVLGVSQSASKSTLKAKFYELSLQHHPDRNPGDEKSTQRFLKINEAYSLLADESKRREYDRSLSARTGDQAGTSRTGFKQTMRRHAEGFSRSTLHPDDWILHRDPKKTHYTGNYYDYNAHRQAHYPSSSGSSTSRAGTSSSAANAKARTMFYEHMREQNKRQPTIIFTWSVIGFALFFLLNGGYIQMIFV
ncbi:hypothetical protein HDU98_005298 [Podochytrium sp. JEL0797]|nr:hypothetical protein HDU98_005298 [Podochytrium sp. JEL0797]